MGLPSQPPATERPFYISIGQIPLSLHIEEEEIMQMASDRYAAFRIPPGRSLPVFFQADDAEDDGSA